jgi:hypothetical protein
MSLLIIIWIIDYVVFNLLIFISLISNNYIYFTISFYIFSFFSILNMTISSFKDPGFINDKKKY